MLEDLSDLHALNDALHNALSAFKVCTCFGTYNTSFADSDKRPRVGFQRGTNFEALVLPACAVLSIIHVKVNLCLTLSLVYLLAPA